MASLQHTYSWLSSLNTKNKPTSRPSSKTTRFKLFFSLNTEPSEPTSQEPTPVDPVKLALNKAKAYKKSMQEAEISKPIVASGETDGNEKEIPASVKAAMEKAKEYKKNKGNGVAESGSVSGLKSESGGSSGTGLANKSSNKKEKLSVSNIDFVGLYFADKKEGRALPAGLVPISNPFPEGDMPEVEIIVGDTSKFGDTTTSKPEPTQEDNSEFYKPKVSTWGVFPRPGNISKTYGGGKTIHPGDVLETTEERAAKDQRTKELLAGYKKSIGLNIDPKLKLECEKALKDGDSMMDSGKLQEALAYYEEVMNNVVFQSELHGLAALQWSICQDSLSRPNEARSMYEKLQSHPSPKVSKRARQFMFSFQAMEMMKVTGSNFVPESTGYQNYFDAFVEDKTNPVGGVSFDEGTISQVLPYMIFLVSPIFIILLVAVQRGTLH